MMGSAAYTNKWKEEPRTWKARRERGIDWVRESGQGLKKKSQGKAVYCCGLISKESCDLFCSQNCPKQVLRQLVKGN